MATQLGLAACSALLTLLALSGDPPIVALFAVAFVAAGLGAVDQPTRSSAIPRLVPAERLPAAIALNQLNFQTASIIGPAVGGLLIATVGIAGAYAVDMVSFLATLTALFAIRPLPPLRDVARPGLAAIAEGLRFARRKRAILGSFAIDLNAMVFGMPTSLFPVLALDVFKAGGLRAAGRGAGRWRVPRRTALRMGLPGGAHRPRHRARGDRLGPGDHRLRAADRLVPPCLGLPGTGRHG
jgi:MFS family permease